MYGTAQFKLYIHVWIHAFTGTSPLVKLQNLAYTYTVTCNFGMHTHMYQ